MGIDAVTSQNRTNFEPDEVASPEDRPAPAGNTAQAYTADGAQPVAPATSTGGDDFGHLLANLFSGHKSSADQANHFDFFALLAKIFDGTNESTSPAPKKTSPSPSAAPSPGVGKTEDQKPKELTSSDVQSKLSTSATGPQDYDQGFKQSAHIEGTKTVGDFTMSGKADASVYAGAGTKSTSYAGPNGVGASVEADARIGVSASASGSITSKYGSISGSARATAEIYAHAKAYVSANSKGATAGADVEVGAHVKAEAQADAEALGGLVSGHAAGVAEAGAGGKAGAKIGISYDPPSAVVDAKADAFAGARAAFDAKGGMAGMTYGIHGEAWAGVGAKVEVEAGMTDGKFHFTFGAGISLGVGTFLKFDFELDLKPIGKALGTFFSALSGLFNGGSGDGSHANKAVSDAVNRIQPGAVPASTKPKTDESTDAEETKEPEPTDEPEAPSETPAPDEANDLPELSDDTAIA